MLLVICGFRASFLLLKGALSSAAHYIFLNESASVSVGLYTCSSGFVHQADGCKSLLKKCRHKMKKQKNKTKQKLRIKGRRQ